MKHDDDEDMLVSMLFVGLTVLVVLFVVGGVVAIFWGFF